MLGIFKLCAIFIIERTTTQKPATSTSKEEHSDASNALPEDITSDVDTDQANKILIKLKYLNETLKEVEGSLDELLKDFKG